LKTGVGVNAIPLLRERKGGYKEEAVSDN